MRIAIVGSGYVGLTTGACLAELGHQVCCNDLDLDRIAALKRGEVPIYEPGLDDIIHRARENGNLQFTGSVTECIGEAEIVLLAVGTPSGPSGQIDLSQLEGAARRIAPHLAPGAVVVIKSTVVVGTCARVREIIAEERKALDFSVASNPEFLREGSAVEDFMRPDRIVIGADDRGTARKLRALYRPLTSQGARLVSTTSANAELTKYAANAFLALKIGFINDVAELCERAGGDVRAVAEAVGLDTRIGQSFLSPGPGYGGSCFPKDTRAFAATGRRHGAPQALVETLIRRNEERKRDLAHRIVRDPDVPRGGRVCVLGLAFKANTDDMRESAALSLVPVLQSAGLEVVAHDPQAMSRAGELLPGIELAESPYAAARDAHAIVVLTEWPAYRRLDLDRLAKVMAGHTIFDYRNLLSPEKTAASGFRHVGLGRPGPAPFSAGEQRSGAAGAVANLDRAAAAFKNV